ncbi:hypothetical protein Krac_10430 [Ktedonobacter racemifer DSM 44963]|uniref:Uncharacterized protein n=1 Tax=Ktedonobacter racemifer DSM 44963 TaxID=485913 RepID=D6TGY8_KTERA|nr:hypothetical protein Krac_10430 [Ktedonobacter racemifer DSM 44963]
MHRPRSQQLVAQVSQIARLCANEGANSPQPAALIGSRLKRMGFAKRDLQKKALASQEGLQLGEPVVAIYSLRVFK